MQVFRRRLPSGQPHDSADRAAAQGLRDLRRRACARRSPQSATTRSGTSRTSTASGCRSSAENGEDVAAPAYLELLAAAYDSLKAVSTEVVVLGGALSPRGLGQPRARSRHTHSPTRFIVDMGAAYKASGRTKPVMDALSINPFPDNSSHAAGDAARQHLDRRSRTTTSSSKLLGQAFDGTAQPGSTLPIYYGEFGVESLLRRPRRRRCTPATSRRRRSPWPEKTQAAYYRKAVELSFCQPTVAGIFMFLVVDERDAGRWQSGFYYADKTAKTSLAAMKQAIRADARRRSSRSARATSSRRRSTASGPSGRTAATASTSAATSTALRTSSSSATPTRRSSAS